MNLDNPPQHDETDPNEKLREENEILKIKLQAEFGAVFDENDGGNLPPDLEQQFLENVYQFEKAWEKQDIVTVGKMLNNPTFVSYDNLEPAEAVNEWLLVSKKYEDAGIEVDFEYEYPFEVKYRFLTEELPTHETVHVNMPGMTIGFLYEEFHPNIGGDLEKLVKKFLGAWMEKDLDSCMSCLSERQVMETGFVIKSEELKDRIRNMFDCFEAFENCSFQMHEMSYDKQVSQDSMPEYALGYAEGEIEWTAIVDSGEKLDIQGPFKLFFEAKPYDWTIMFFVMPGWNWLDE